MSDPGVVSIGICAHNEEGTIGELLEQIMAEDIPIKEVIVAVAGEDETADIVSSKSEKFESIRLLEEDKRQGQIEAQNKILSKISGEMLMMVDGDGTIRPGSLEKLYREFSGDKVIAGKEIPETEDSFLGQILSAYTDVHHEICLRSPRFSTHIGILPADLVETFPDIMLDDVYVEHRAMEENLEIIYLPEAVKYHNMPQSIRFFFHQQKKNWAGRFQAEKRGYRHTKPENLLLKTYLEKIFNSSINQKPALVGLGAVEILAYISAKFSFMKDGSEVKWFRPGKD